jgi:hypothetical protein
MKLYQSWIPNKKKWDKLCLKVRIGAITIFDLYIDGTKRTLGMTIMNFGIFVKLPGK